MCIIASKTDIPNSDFLPIQDVLEHELVAETIEYIQVFARYGGVTRVFLVNLHGYTNEVIDNLQTKFQAMLACNFNGKPFRIGTKISDYGLSNGSTIFCSPRLLGGSESGKPAHISIKDLDVSPPKFEGVNPIDGEWISYVSKRSMSCDLFKASQRLAKRTRKSHKTYETQAFESVRSLTGIREFLNTNVDVDILSLVEDLSLLLVQLVRAPHIIDATLALITFLKLRTGGSLILNSANMVELIVSDIMGPSVQSEEETDLLSKVTDFRDFLNNWDSLKDSAIVKKSTRLFRFAAAVGICAQVGIKLDDATLKACRAEASGIFAGPNFLCALLDTLALLLQRALMFAKTGKWETFFHGPKSYGAWYDKCQELKRHHLFIGNLEAHGTSYHAFVKDLSDAIETGKAILKFGEKSTGFELLAIKKLLNDMQLIQASVMTYTAAQESRRPPFALLVHGGSAVCKSSFVEMLFHYSGQVMNLPTTSDFKYTRDPSAPFWSGWNSAKWFVVLDDVAYVSPSSPMQDMSLMEIIQLVNDVPMVPNQASLEDKGKNPVRAKFVVATTNTKHLNAHAHFSCPLAVQRRLPFVVTLEPKPEYARDDAPGMIDPVKLPLISDDMPDFWLISVDKVTPCGDEGRAQFENIQKFGDIWKFLDWLKSAMDIFHEVQLKASTGCTAMQGFKLCHKCNRVKCVCTLVQAHEYHLPQGAVFGFPFTKVEEEGPRTWVYNYTPCVKEHTNYTLKTTVFLDGVQERSHTTQVCMTEGEQTPKPQADEIAMAEVLSEIVRRQAEMTDNYITSCAVSGFRAYLAWYSRSRTVRYYSHAAMEWAVCRKLACWAANRLTVDNRELYQFCGDTVANVYMSRKWRMVLKGLGVAAALAATYKIVSSVRKMCTPKDDGDLQGLRLSVPDTHFKKSEKENVWKRDDYETSSFDTTPLNVSYASLPRDQLLSLVQRNTARITCSNGVRAREGNAFCVGGHLWVTNNHTMFGECDLRITLETEGTRMGASPNLVMKLRQHEIFRQLDSDLAWFMVYGWDAKRDLRELIRKPSLMGEYRGAYVGFDKLRSKQEIVVAAVKMGSFTTEELGTLTAWHGNAFAATVKGDCGMPLVVHRPVAAIVGLHTVLCMDQSVWATAIDSDKMNRAIVFFDRPMIQCGMPIISAPSKPKTLGALSQYSPLRWLEEGAVTTFGSFQEFKVTSRSKVQGTLLREAILADRGWKVDAVRPEMKDWRPWRHALVDITQQQFGAIDSMKLRACARGYVADIIAGLSSDDLNTIQVLSDEATVNGIDGVKFVDKMNFRSSMGEPYCKSKKFFLEGEIGKKVFIPEVAERISHVNKCYEAGARACPVFSGQLKDEPRSQAKVDAGKIRVFTGAPADWSFVVRQNLLALVKVIQENPLLFEASPGCAAQTLEWEQYYDFLTSFGFDRIIAGDYGKFDKKMEALIILEAFWILAQICLAAGWTEEQVLVIYCIAEDTAYSYVNFNGDLIMFFGSNPSGQPLTVVINCIVNALYMRYCFVELSPFEGSDFEKARRFKDHVNLLTYGDDNAMGVSRDADWFNHTAIQEVLGSIGVEYTMADKLSESRPFIHISEVSYLKRTWRWDEDIGAVVCPLEEASIQKMLTVCTPSGTESPEVHMASVIVSAVNEWFWYGKERFERERAWLWNLAVKHNIHHEVKAKSFPTWTELCFRFERSSLGLSTKRIEGCFVEHPRTVVPK